MSGRGKKSGAPSAGHTGRPADTSPPAANSPQGRSVTVIVLSFGGMWGRRRSESVPQGSSLGALFACSDIFSCKVHRQLAAIHALQTDNSYIGSAVTMVGQ